MAETKKTTDQLDDSKDKLKAIESTISSIEKQFGKGVDPWHDKAERWVKKKFKNPFIQHLALGFIEWLKQKWIDVKVANTMRDIDRQSEEIKKIWEEKDKPKTIITTTPSEVKGLDDMEIKYDGGS